MMIRFLRIANGTLGLVALIIFFAAVQLVPLFAFSPQYHFKPILFNQEIHELVNWIQAKNYRDGYMYATAILLTLAAFITLVTQLIRAMFSLSKHRHN